MRIQEMWYACCTARDRASGPGKGVAQACSEDGVMLPRLLPMLAVPAAPFDSPEYSFEVMWDGIRALAAVETAIGQRLDPLARGESTGQRQAARCAATSRAQRELPV